MRIRSLLFASVTIVCIAGACNEAGTEEDRRAKALEEIEQAERDFAKMASEIGVAEAFWYYADSNAVIKRENDTLVIGKDEIRKYYSAPFYSSASVNWTPDFSDASPDGNMGYTYGKYSWQSKDTAGRTIQFSGVFHTVWKRQPDGSWRYVWD